MVYKLDRERRVVGIINLENEIVFITLHDFYLIEGLEQQLRAIEMGYVNE